MQAFFLNIARLAKENGGFMYLHEAIPDCILKSARNLQVRRKVMIYSFLPLLSLTLEDVITHLSCQKSKQSKQYK